MYENTFSVRYTGPKVSSSNSLYRKKSQKYQDGTFEKSFFEFLNIFSMRRRKVPKNWQKRGKCHILDFREIYFSFLAITPSIMVLETLNFYQLLKIVTRILIKNFKNIKPILN
jgi:hypothetical protein